MLLTVLVPLMLVVQFEKVWAVSDRVALPGAVGLVETVAVVVEPGTVPCVVHVTPVLPPEVVVIVTLPELVPVIFAPDAVFVPFGFGLVSLSTALDDASAGMAVSSAATAATAAAHRYLRMFSPTFRWYTHGRYPSRWSRPEATPLSTRAVPPCAPTHRHGNWAG